MSLSEMPAEIVTKLQSKDLLSEVTMVTEKIGDIASAIETTVGKLGLCVVVLTPTAGVSYPNAPGPMLDPLRIVIAVFESVIMNQAESGSQVPAADAAIEILAALHLFKPPSFNFPLVVDGPNALQLVADPEYLVYHCNFTTKLVLVAGEDVEPDP